MDAFKAAEIERMRLSGNKPWRDFFDAAESNQVAGIGYVYSLDLDVDLSRDAKGEPLGGVEKCTA